MALGSILLNSTAISSVKTHLPYAPPACEYNNYSAVAGILTGSELTDDGAGEFLIPGDEFNF